MTAEITSQHGKARRGLRLFLRQEMRRWLKIRADGKRNLASEVVQFKDVPEAVTAYDDAYKRAVQSSDVLLIDGYRATLMASLDMARVERWRRPPKVQ